MRAIIAVVLATTFALGCEDRQATPAREATDELPADNTEKNERDRADTKTPLDQKENEGDLAITKAIREDIVARERLSTNAKNVKVITADGIVTLRGPVETEQERTEVAQLASRVSGVKRVENQLEVKSN